MSKDKSFSLISKGFLLAGAYNIIGMLWFSKLFTNEMMATVDPNVFSLFGQFAVLLWGMAYCSVFRAYSAVPSLVSIFALEKLLYSMNWAHWVFTQGETLTDIAATSKLTASFYSLYGVGDFIFFLFFVWVVLLLYRERTIGT